MTVAVSPARSTTRVEWVDAAKGLSIFGVCLVHIVSGIPGALDTWLGELSRQLDPIRMPLFFLLSGMFAHRVLERTLGDLWYRRLWFLLVPYLVFTPIQAYIRISFIEEPTTWLVIKAIVLGDPGLWFLYALMAYNLFAWILRNLHWAVAIGLSFLPILVGPLLMDMVPQWPRNLLQYLPVFMVGLYGRKLWLAVATLANRWWMWLLAVALAVGFSQARDAVAAILMPSESRWEWSNMVWFSQVHHLAALPLGVLLGVLLCNIPGLAWLFRAIGHNTLPIYATHQAALYYLSKPVMNILGDGMWERIIGSAGICIVVGAVAIWVSKQPVIGWVFHPPAVQTILGRRAP